MGMMRWHERVLMCAVGVLVTVCGTRIEAQPDPSVEQKKTAASSGDEASGCCPVRKGMRNQDQLVCPRSRVEVYSQYAIHLAAEEQGVHVPFLGNRACPMSGDPVLPDAFFEHEGQRVYFCCQKCARTGGKSPETWIRRAYPSRATKENGDRMAPVHLGQTPSAKGSMDKDTDGSGSARRSFQGYDLRFHDEAAQERFRSRRILELTRALNPKITGPLNSICPVTGERIPESPDVLAIYEDKLIAFKDWASLERFLAAPSRWPSR